MLVLFLSNERFRLSSAQMGTNFKKSSGELALLTIEHIQPIVLLVLIFITYFIDKSNLSANGYGQIFLYILAYGLILRQLSYLIKLKGLPVILRRKSNDPFLVFCVIMVIDFISMTVLYTFIGNRNDSNPLSFENIKETLDMFFAFRDHTKLLFNDLKFSHLYLIMIINIWLFYTSFITHVFNYKKFKRDDEDIDWLVSINILRRDYRANLGLIASMKSKTEQTHTNEIMSLIGIGEIEKAKEKIHSTHNGFSKLEEYQVYQKMFGLALYAKYKKKVLINLIEDAVIVGFPDEFFYDTITPILLSYDGIAEDLAGILEQFKEKYPLTLTELYLLYEFIDEAEELVNKKNNTSLGEIIRYRQIITIKAQNASSKSELRTELTNWHDLYFEEFKKQFFLSSKEDEKMIELSQLYIIMFVSRYCGSEVFQKLEAIFLQLKDEWGDDTKSFNFLIDTLNNRLIHLQGILDEELEDN